MLYLLVYVYLFSIGDKDKISTIEVSNLYQLNKKNKV